MNHFNNFIAPIFLGLLLFTSCQFIPDAKGSGMGLHVNVPGFSASLGSVKAPGSRALTSGTTNIEVDIYAEAELVDTRTFWVSPGENELWIDGLEEGTQYYLDVRAFDVYGNLISSGTSEWAFPGSYVSASLKLKGISETTQIMAMPDTRITNFSSDINPGQVMNFRILGDSSISPSGALLQIVQKQTASGYVLENGPLEVYDDQDQPIKAVIKTPEYAVVRIYPGQEIHVSVMGHPINPMATLFLQTRPAVLFTEANAEQASSIISDLPEGHSFFFQGKATPYSITPINSARDIHLYGSFDSSWNYTPDTSPTTELQGIDPTTTISITGTPSASDFVMEGMKVSLALAPTASASSVLLNGCAYARIRYSEIRGGNESGTFDYTGLAVTGASSLRVSESIIQGNAISQGVTTGIAILGSTQAIVVNNCISGGFLKDQGTAVGVSLNSTMPVILSRNTILGGYAQADAQVGVTLIGISMESTAAAQRFISSNVISAGIDVSISSGQNLNIYGVYFGAGSSGTFYGNHISCGRVIPGTNGISGLTNAAFFWVYAPHAFSQINSNQLYSDWSGATTGLWVQGSYTLGQKVDGFQTNGLSPSFSNAMADSIGFGDMATLLTKPYGSTTVSLTPDYGDYGSGYSDSSSFFSLDFYTGSTILSGAQGPGATGLLPEVFYDRNGHPRPSDKGRWSIGAFE